MNYIYHFSADKYRCKNVWFIFTSRGYGIRTHDFKDGFLAMYRTFFILTMIKARKNFFHRKKVKLYKTLRPRPTRRTHDFAAIWFAANLLNALP